jgi:uncharacterized protein (DUF934 family)
MRRILRQHEIVVDDWRYLGEDASESDALIIPFSELRANSASWRDWRGRLGVRLAPADPTEQLSDELSRLALVAVEFPNPGDGRGYSHARLLRQRLHFKGELRAVGAGVKQDQVFLLARCGFDAIDLAPGENLDEALKALQRYTVAYQPGDPSVRVGRQRFFA